MANNFDSNFTRMLFRVFLKAFKTQRILTNNVDTQLLSGKFSPKTGDTVDFKRPTDYKSKRTTTGDLSGTPADIITGKASGIVQEYISVDVEFSEFDQSLKMDQLEQLLRPAMTRIVTDLEVDFALFMLKNTGLRSGDPGNAIGANEKAWDDVALSGAVMQAHGVPMDDMWNYAVNPFTQRSLASDQRSLGAGGVAGQLIKTAQDKATIAENFAGFNKVMTATALGTYTTDTVSDRAGTLSAPPTPTYVAAKDTMTQVWAVQDFGANLKVQAGETIEVTGRFRLNLSTRKLILDETGTAIKFAGTVTTDVTLDSNGDGDITVTGPAIFEATGAYNTVDSALTTDDAVTLLGPNTKTLQPNLFWHKQAFGLGFVPLQKLFATDTVGDTEDGLSLRVTKFSDGIKNVQIVRFDILPAYAILNPFFAGQSFGQPGP